MARTRGQAAGEDQRRRLRTRFGPEPIAVFPLLLALVGTLPAATTWRPAAWLPLLPVLGIVWVLRARVVARPAGLEVGNGLRRRTVPWARVEGFDVPRRGPVRLLSDGRRTPLTALPRRELPQLLAAAEQVAGPAGTAPGAS